MSKPPSSLGYSPIPYGKHAINQDDIEAVVSVLQSDFITQGPQVPLFEKQVAEVVKASHAIAVNSATSALHIACLALDLQPGDTLWTSANTFVASANCGRYCGANVDFVDIDPRTYNICPEQLSHKLAHAKAKHALPKILVVVHLTGQPCDMQPIHQLAQQYGVYIIEDASHAIWARYQGEPVGNCRYSDICVFSFHPVKIVTTGEGGVATTNQPQLAKKMQQLRTHGITKSPSDFQHPETGPWYYEQHSLGFNYRMTDIHAALGRSQLDQLEHFIARRHEIAHTYNKALQNMPITLPYQMPHAHSSYHLYVIRLQFSQLTLSHSEVFKALQAQGIGVNLHYLPVHLHPYYRELGFKEGDFPEAEQYAKEAISLPIYSSMTEQEQARVISVLTDILYSALPKREFRDNRLSPEPPVS